ncbi:hypothetical protein [Pontibacter sp. G13]|uniref:ArnT family glycosyltransferase n=1 Tax=Pontibacter sp. G13 TaxID=3074898 RepID=UPI002889996A|nr:hypothetical protein [Pontibacter sp. G13]WNJ17175.1 hypothetical protein RJD25_20150 [Pontibacter sp. G13]
MALTRLFVRNSIPRILMVLLQAALLGYSLLRAFRLSMTHDESSTFLNFHHRWIPEAFWDPSYWVTANLHPLNSWLMQGTGAVFGIAEGPLRLPNVFGHLLYLIFSARLSRSIAPNAWWAIAAFLVLNLNPYLLEFFSLARGYGLANGFMMMGGSFLFWWLSRPNLKDGIWISIAGFFMVISQFIWINAWLAILLIMGIRSWAWMQEEPRTRSELVKMWLAPMGTTLGLAILLWNPLRWLSQGGEFQWGEDALMVSWRQMIMDSLMGQGYLSGATTEVFMGIALVIWIVGGVLALRIFLQRRWNDPFMVMAAALFWACLSAMILQHELLGSQYLVRRTALIFYPLSAMLGVGIARELLKIRYWMGGVSVGLMMGFGIWHFSRTAQLTHTQEWGFDANTRHVVEYVNDQYSDGQPLTLGIDWVFEHTAEFYRLTLPLEGIAPLEYSKELDLDRPYDYYYIEPMDLPLLEADYQLVTQFEDKAILLRRKVDSKIATESP